MKNIYLVILFILIILAILIMGVILINNNNINSNNEIELPSTQTPTDSRSVDNIYMSIEEGSITPTGLTVIIDDKNEVKSNVLISMYYYIDKKVGNEWKEIYCYLSPLEIAVGHLEYPHKSILNWSDDLGELEPGTYRIRYYPILNQSKEVEFNIN